MIRRAALLLICCALSLTAAQAQPPRPTPYMASIASGRAMMRTGPGQTYPGTWLYVRRDLPIRVLRIYHEWRMIEDPGGTRGWMLVSLLSDQRTAIVRGEGLGYRRRSLAEVGFAHQHGRDLAGSLGRRGQDTRGVAIDGQGHFGGSIARFPGARPIRFHVIQNCSSSAGC